MQKTIVTALAILASTAVATAADLPSKKTTPAAPEAAYPASWYVGVTGGQNFGDNTALAKSTSMVGAQVGYNVNKAVAVEIDYDHYFKNGQNKANERMTVNALYSPFSMFGFSPYVLAGVGEESHDYQTAKDGKVRNIYQAGAGVRYDLTKEWQADARYRYVADFTGRDKDANVVTVGLNYKF